MMALGASIVPRSMIVLVRSIAPRRVSMLRGSVVLQGKVAPRPGRMLHAMPLRHSLLTLSRWHALYRQ